MIEGGRARWALLAAAVALAGGTLAVRHFRRRAPFLDLLDLSKPAVLRTEGSKPVPWVLSWSRRPMEGGVVEMSVEYTLEATGCLRSLALDVADDRDGDGVFGESEWETRAWGTIEEEDGRTVARIPPVRLSNSSNGYGVRIDRIGEDPQRHVLARGDLAIR